jgi:hypothetical protein
MSTPRGAGQDDNALAELRLVLVGLRRSFASRLRKKGPSLNAKGRTQRAERKGQNPGSGRLSRVAGLGRRCSRLTLPREREVGASG